MVKLAEPFDPVNAIARVEEHHAAIVARRAEVDGYLRKMLVAERAFDRAVLACVHAIDRYIDEQVPPSDRTLDLMAALARAYEVLQLEGSAAPATMVALRRLVRLLFPSLNGRAHA